MCMINSLPKFSKSMGNKKRNLALTLKVCPDDKTFYRFRLLGFSSEGKNDRDDVHIQRFVHQHWGVNKEKGYPVLEDEITCPVTPHVHVEGNRYNACKMCDIANKYFVTFKESNWTDKAAAKKNKEFGRKYQAIVPVYVVNDPVYEGNNNKFKVIIFNDKKKYQDFRDRIEKASTQYCVFNGVNAVDCCIHVSEIEEKKNAGTPKEYIWKHKEIDKIVFSNKPYDIPSINKNTVNAMGFDEEYYTTSSPEEIQAFYKKYCTVSNDDIPMDDGNIPVYDKPETNTVEKTNSVKVTQMQNQNLDLNSDLPNDSLDDLIEGISCDVQTSPETNLNADNSSNESQKSNEATSDEINDLLDGLDI